LKAIFFILISMSYCGYLLFSISSYF